jgi:hypothetical protein
LSLAIICPTCIVTFSANLNLGPGLSLSHLFEYLAAILLNNEAIIGRALKLELPALPTAFAVVIGYTLLTTFVAGALTSI